MREIKFRAWDKKLGKMYKPFDLYWKAHQHNPPEDFLNTGSETFSPNAVFLQYTGLKDKNGKEIWEGDIILNSKIGEKSQIIFEEGAFVWECWRGVVRVRSYINTLIQEVIGNIYENPELLK